jgi:hypothetical protein
MTSEAKMGFLHTKLSKECDQVIAGLFPDDEGYAEALRCCYGIDMVIH